MNPAHQLAFDQLTARLRQLDLRLLDLDQLMPPAELI
jgi:hypothetical protein